MIKARLHFHHSLYQWWGVPSRYIQLVGHLNPKCFATTTSATSDVVDQAGMPVWQRQINALIEPGLKRHAAPWHTLNDLAAEASTFDLCSDGKVDIVHFLDGEHSGPYLPRLFRQRLRDVRSVATFHQPPDLAEQVIDGPSLRMLDAIVLMAPSQLPFFTRFVPAERLHVFLHGVDTSFFTPRAGRRKDGPLRCITTGLHLRDWDALYAVAEALPDVVFTIVTSGRLSLRQLDNVRVVSGISDADLAGAYRAADVLFLPVKDATANNSLLEGMASGLTVVSTNIEAVRAYVPRSAGFLIDDNAVPRLVEALTTLAENPKVRARMASAARKRAEQLSWTQVVRQYEALYAQLLAKSGLPPPKLETPPRIKRREPVAQGIPPAARPVPDAPRGALTHLADWTVDLRCLGLSHEADMLVDALVATQPDDHDTQSALAASAEASWQWTDAIAHWDAFLRMCPEHRRGTGLARKARCQALSGAFAAARRTLETGVRHVEVRLAAAGILTAFATPAEATATWHAFTTQYPDRIDGFLGLARLHLRQSRFDEADTLLDHVRKVWPYSVHAAALWARSANDSGNLALAETRWRQVLALFPRRDALLLPIARHYGLTDDRAACDAILADSDADNDLRAEAMLQFHLARFDWQAATAEAWRLVQRHPDNPRIRLRHAKLLVRLGTPHSLDSAVEILRGLRHLSPEAIEILPELASALIATGAADEARALVGSMPSDLTDSHAQILRLWGDLDPVRVKDGLRYWTAIFSGFGLGPDGGLLADHPEA